MEKIISEIQSLYNELDKDIQNFKFLTGLNCISRCGFCCYSQKVETTILSVYPLANSLFQKNLGEYFIEKIELKKDKTCVFFQLFDDSIGFGGNCGEYEFRPLICRLFGFSGILNKNNEPIYSPCKIIKNHMTQENLNRLSGFVQSIKIPIMRNYSLRLSQISPLLTQKEYPINEAIKIALEKIGYWFQFSKPTGSSKPQKAA